MTSASHCLLLPPYSSRLANYPYPSSLAGKLDFSRLSIDSGHGGIVTFEAKTDELYDHYIKDFHAVPIFQPHSGGPKLLMLADEGAQEIFSTYLS